jgi:hypothetical protein
MFLKNRYFQRITGGGFLERITIRGVSLVELLLASTHKDLRTVRMLLTARWQRRTLVTFNEAFLVHSIARSMAHLAGDFAEVGVYQGSTAKLICEAKGDKPIHLFDTFEGLPPGSTAIEKFIYAKPKYRCSFAAVQRHLEGYPNVHFYKGFFPESASSLDPERRFSFVHMDVDLYESTLSCLRYFYPRMAPGGIMLSHDYSILEGVERAFTEFLADKPERAIELPSTQAMVVKL